ncbi:MAG: hypothetical protein WCX97_05405 [Candidatus Magasanikbacteria bacterium]
MYNIYTKSNNHNDQEPPLDLPKDKKPDIGKYIDPTGEMPAGRFKFEVWLVKHKVKIYQWTVGLLAAFSIVSWSFSLWKIGDYLIFGLEQDQLLIEELSQFNDYTVWHEHFSPLPLEIVSATALSGTTGKVDVYAMIANQNDNFFVSFDYYFLFNDNVTEKKTSFVLPGETKPIAELGAVANAVSGVEVVLENITWKRVDPHSMSDAVGWQNDRLNFVVSNLQIIVPTTAEGIDATAAQFDLTNNSAYGYRSAEFLVALMQGETVMTLMPLMINNFQSLETRAVDLRSYAPNLFGTAVKIYPLINVYSRSVYLTI